MEFFFVMDRGVVILPKNSGNITFVDIYIIKGMDETCLQRGNPYKEKIQMQFYLQEVYFHGLCYG